MSDDNNNGSNKLDRVLIGERDLKRVMLTVGGALVTTVILSSAAGIWAMHTELDTIKAWQQTHDVMYDHGIKEVAGLARRVKTLEDFANRGDRFTRGDGDKIEARVRLLENTSIRIEAKLDAILDKLGTVKRQTGGTP